MGTPIYSTRARAPLWPDYPHYPAAVVTIMQRSLFPILLAFALFALPRQTVIEQAAAQLNYGGGSPAHIATNAALTAATIAAYPNGVWRDDFAAGSGAPPLFYRPSGNNCTLNSGAGDNGSQVAASGVGCWLATFPSSGIDIREFGADSTGTNDSGPAINGALTAAGASKVLVPEGKFKCNSAVSISVPARGITLEGKGSALSVLHFPTTNGLAFTLTDGSRAPHIRDLSLLTDDTGASTGITITQNSTKLDTIEITDITNVTLKGNDGGAATQYWGTGIVLNNVSFLNSYGLNIVGPSTNLGTGISLKADATTPSIVFNFTAGNFQNLAVGITAGNWVQGITVTQSNFTNGATGVSIASGGSGQVQLMLLGNQWGYLTNAAVDSEGPFADVMFHDNLVLAPSGGSGVIIGNATRVSVENNHFVALSGGTGTGVNIKSTGGLGLGGIISGNILNTFGTGINLQASASGFLVARNMNQGNTTFISNSGSNNMIDGETVSATVAIGSAVSLTTGVPKDVTSIRVPPGNWLISGNVKFNTAVTTGVSSIGASISTTSNTFGTGSQFPSSGTGFSSLLATGSVYFAFSSRTTVYLIAVSGFSTSTQAAYGSITAVRQLQ